MASTDLTLGTTAAPARLAGVVTVVVALVSLTGWILDYHPLASVIPGAVEMKVNTAICILLCGSALFILSFRTGASLEGVARAMAALACGTGAATLCEYLFGWQLGIDELITKDSSAAFAVFHGRMSPFSACGFIILGFAVGAVRIRYLDRFAKIAAILGLAIGVMSLVGYVWNADELTTDRWLPPVAINTAICFVMIAAGVMVVERSSSAERSRRVALAGVELRILTGFAFAIALLVLGGSFTYRMSVQLSMSVEWIAHTQEVRATLSDISGSLAGANLVARDYWVTKDAERRAEYGKLMNLARSKAVELQRLVSDNPAQTSNARQLKSHLESALGELEQCMRAFDNYGLAAARAVVTVTRSANTVGRVRDDAVFMDQRERQLMQQRQAAAAKVRLTTLTSMMITLAAAVALFFALFRSVHNEMLARRAAEQALRDSDQYNRSIIESSPDAVSVLSTGAHITQMTHKAMDLMGIADFATVAGRDWCLFWNGEDREAARAAIALARTGVPGRFSAVSELPGEQKRWWDVIVMPMAAQHGEAARLLAVARDVSESKRVESNLLTANRFLDSLIEHLPVMVVVKDAADLRFVRVNRMFEQLMNIPAAAVRDKSLREMLEPEEADLTERSDREALASGSLLAIPERSILTKDGVRILDTKKVPLLDETGTARFLLSIATDITERKLSEQAIHELNAQLQAKAALLESSNKELESFSYSVSHDLRAPLRAIDGFAEMIQEDYAGKLDAEAQRYLVVIRENSKRMGMLIDDLLAFSRLGRQPVTRVDINVQSLVQEVIEELLHAGRQQSAGSAPQIEVGLLPDVRGDRALLRQVWLNLISNALKYSGKHPQPHIEIGGVTQGAENQYFVRDNGVGFNMLYAEKLFGVFQRLHRADEFSGTGVGLAIVQRIVARQGGRVWAEGKINEGAVFSFALPREA